MNVHHLELFYYVAKHGGISSAVRQMPYGIQQPAVSGQMGQLEKDLGVQLFQRQPFRLTAAGRELMDFVEPFFDNVAVMEERIREAGSPQLRIGASEVVLKLHAGVLERLGHQHPQLRLGLRSGLDTELAAWLRDRQVDVIVTPLADGRVPKRDGLPLLQLPLALLVPKSWRLATAEELWKERRVEQPLISLPPRESVSLIFQAGLRKRRVVWPVTIEASSLELITQYVADGRGAGLSVACSELARHPKVQMLPLLEFPRLQLAVLWQGTPNAIVQTFLEEVRQYVREKSDDPVQVVGNRQRGVQAESALRQFDST
jgi:DNA-binding transcriptional LysR family regulator